MIIELFYNNGQNEIQLITTRVEIEAFSWFYGPDSYLVPDHQKRWTDEHKM